MRILSIALLALLVAGCRTEPQTIVIQQPPPRAPPRTDASYSAGIDRACAKYVLSRRRNPDAAPAAAAAGDAYCASAPAHGSGSTKQDAKWLDQLRRRIDRGEK